MKTVNDIMTQNPVSVEEGITIMNVISKLKDNRISQVPVVSGKRYVGMLGYREILRRKSISINARVGNMAVTSSTLSPSDSIESALRKLKQSGNNAIPVVEKDHLVGIVSRSDMGNIASLIEESLLGKDVKNNVKELRKSLKMRYCR